VGSSAQSEGSLQRRLLRCGWSVCMTDTPIQLADRAPRRLPRGARKSIRPANLRLKLEPDGADLGAKAASLRRDQTGSGDYRTCIRVRAVAVAWDLKNQRRQLIERVDGLQADQNQRCDHQIKAEMHEGLATKCLLPRAWIAQGREPNSVRIGKGKSPGKPFAGIRNRKTSAAAEVMPSSRTSSVGGPLFDASFLLVHTP
jgi:hypothetical protein